MNLLALRAAAGLPPDYDGIVERWWRPLAARIAGWQRSLARPLLVGVQGVQGSGKTTLCRFLAALLAQRGLTVAVLSIDDVYRTRAERLALARTVHPLCATRGVPGTHDMALLGDTLAALAGRGSAHLPRFDKAADDRVPLADWPRAAAPVDVVLLEGWCVGATVPPPGPPINDLEASEDPDGVWRGWWMAAQAADHVPLWHGLDRLVVLKAPDFACVAGWRAEQEARLRARTGAGMDAAALARFIAHYERLTRHILAGGLVRGGGDTVFHLTAGHGIGAATGL